MSVVLYVAPQAKGLGDGSSSANAMGSVFAAVEAARKISGAVTLKFAKGQYLFTQPLCLDERDNDLTFEGDGAVFTAGVPILGWQDEGDSIVSAPIAEDIAFNRLYFNGGVRERTKLPAKGHFETKQVVRRASTWLANMTPEQQQLSRRLMFFNTQDIPQDLYRLQDTEFVVLQYWAATHGTKVEHINYEKGEILFKEESFRPFCWGFGYYIENVREGLTVAGRWYRDYGQNRIYYRLQEGECLQNLQVTRPTISTLVKIEPTIGQRAQNIRFKGITFTQTDAYPSGKMYRYPQADLLAPVSVLLERAENCSFTECDFTHLGGYGIWLRSGSQRCQIARCKFTFCGAGAVRIGEMERTNGIAAAGVSAWYFSGISDLDPLREQKLYKVSYITVENCQIADCGWYYHGSAGIWVGQSGHNTIAHNDISGPLQWAISVGWTWDIFPLNETEHNTIEKNFIHELGTGILGTHGAIYLLGVSPCTSVKGNYIRNVYSTEYWGGGEGIILDNCCSGIAVQNNVVLGATAGGWGCNFDCFGNVISNNIFCYGQKFQLTRYGDPPKTANPPPNGEVFSQNIILWKEGPLFAEEDWLSYSTFWNNNLYWCESGQPEFLGRSFEEWQALGLDTNSLVADPLLANPENGDFTLDANSPAYSIGFEPFSIQDVGVLPL